LASEEDAVANVEVPEVRVDLSDRAPSRAVEGERDEEDQSPVLYPQDGTVSTISSYNNANVQAVSRFLGRCIRTADFKSDHNPSTNLIVKYKGSVDWE
jgi:hypothetical protein